MNEATIEAPAQDTAPGRTPTLSALDRCDSCGSQAYVAVFFESGSLAFCGHHYREFEVGISKKALKVIDERWQLSDQRLDVSA